MYCDDSIKKYKTVIDEHSYWTKFYGDQWELKYQNTFPVVAIIIMGKSRTLLWYSQNLIQI